TFESFSLDWVARGKNSVADKLSNDAMDACAAGHPVGIVRNEQAEVSASAELDDAAADETAAPDPQDWMGDRGDVTRFVLLRHGQTQMSVDKKYSGHTDVQLTPHGQKQALAAAQALANRGLSFDVIVSSPLKRCQQTAQAAAQALGIDEVETVDELIE